MFIGLYIGFLVGVYYYVGSRCLDLMTMLLGQLSLLRRLFDSQSYSSLTWHMSRHMRRLSLAFLLYNSSGRHGNSRRPSQH
jgi:hypothetical protein